MKETDAIDEYILQHIDEESDYLKALYRDTHVKLLRPRMASGHLQGRMLEMLCNDTPPSGAGNRDLQWLLRTLPGRRVGRGGHVAHI